jgi:hypothetical protein
MIELQQNELTVRAPEVHERAECQIDFQRTLRIPDDNREYPLPAGLGPFPVFHVDDYAGKVPQSWIEHGGVFLPMYQSEAMWLNFGFGGGYPFAIKVAAGKINAVSGEAWQNGLSGKPQDYAVIPEQPWLDGFSIGDGRIRQFVAMPLGEGDTAEGQITGKEEHGGLQLALYPMKADYYEKHLAGRDAGGEVWGAMGTLCFEADEAEMGLAPGGVMQQSIYDDPYGIDAWDTSAMTRCFVHIVNSEAFVGITGRRPPNKPILADEYRTANIPWLDYWNDEVKALKGSKILAGLDSMAAKMIKDGKPVKEPIVQIEDQKVVQLGKRRSKVRDGSF